MTSFLLDLARDSDAPRTVIVMDESGIENPRQYEIQPRRLLYTVAAAAGLLALLLVALVLLTPVRRVFLGPDPETGSEGGMVSRIAENRQYEFISVEHLGVVQDGVEDTTSEVARQWAPAYENYTFEERDGATQVRVDLDVTEAYAPMFEEMWPRALSRLKELGER